MERSIEKIKLIITSILLITSIGVLISCSKKNEEVTSEKSLSVKNIDFRVLEKSSNMVHFSIVQMPQYQLRFKKITDKPNQIVLKEELLHIKNNKPAHNEAIFIYELSSDKPIRGNPFTGNINIKDANGVKLISLNYVNNKLTDSFIASNLKHAGITPVGLRCFDPGCNEPEFSDCVADGLRQLAEDLQQPEELAKCVVDPRVCLIEYGIKAGAITAACTYTHCHLFR